MRTTHCTCVQSTTIHTYRTFAQKGSQAQISACCTGNCRYCTHATTAGRRRQSYLPILICVYAFSNCVCFGFDPLSSIFSVCFLHTFMSFSFCEYLDADCCLRCGTNGCPKAHRIPVVQKSGNKCHSTVDHEHLAKRTYLWICDEPSVTT